MLYIRRTEEKDLDTVMEIYRAAQEFMIASGNPDQWGHSYPTVDIVKEDIDKGASRLLYNATGVHGVFALCDGIEPTYQRIEGES